MPIIAQTVSTTAEKPPVVEVELPTWDAGRYLSLIAAGGQSLNRLADFGVDRLLNTESQKGWKGTVQRGVRLYLVALPLAALTQTLAHESGHIARAAVTDATVTSIQIKRWPWPIPVMDAEFNRQVGTIPLTPEEVTQKLSEDLAVYAGGEESSQLLAATMTEKALRYGRANYFDWILLAYSKLDMPFYSWASLPPDALTSPISFVSSHGFSSDPAQYIVSFSLLEGGGAAGFAAIQQRAHQLRRRVWLNLADLSLWASFANAVNYVATGTPEGTSWGIPLGKIHLVPAAYYYFTPIGFEGGLRAHVVTPSQLLGVTIRRTDTPDSGTLWGGGAALLRREHGSTLPDVRVDLWQRGDESVGYRIEVGWVLSARIANRDVQPSFGFGYKSSGYVPAAPMSSGLMGRIGFHLRF